jgi:hypothetical protein
MALEDYEEVPDRIKRFFEKYPDGSLGGTVEYRDLPAAHLNGEPCLHIIYRALAYRTPDDQRPGVGMASEPVPGLTNFTRGSELMNAETSAWGRALVALGFVAKKVASANEVRSREGGTQHRGTYTYNPERDSGEAASKAQLGRVRKDLKAKGVTTADEFAFVADAVLGVEVETADRLTKAQASYLIDWLQRNPVPTGKSDVPSDTEGLQEALPDGGDPVPWDDPEENKGEAT